MHVAIQDLLSSYAFQQLAPFVVLFIVPAFALFARVHWHTLIWLVAMVFESFSSVLPWNWASAYDGTDGASTSSSRKAKRKGHERSKSNQLKVNGSVSHSDSSDKSDILYYPGLVNISGTYCFLNSVLQAMSSLSYLQPHVEAVYSKAVELDVPTPVLDALRETLTSLNTPHSSKRALRPQAIINALSAPQPGGRRSKLFSSREHQDAQELFQLLSELVKLESVAVDKEGQRDRGLGGLSEDVDDKFSKEVGTSVFDGLTANRRSCVECGYTEAVMHFAFDNWQLSLPRGAACTLDDCLSDYIRLEVLTDCICRKCSMLATHQRLKEEAERLTAASDPSSSQSKKKRARDARKFEARVKAALDEGRIEEDIKGVKMERIFSRASTKQAMIARPPRVLVLHLNRSVHYGSYAGRNSCRVIFPEVLDLTPYTTSGQLSTLPSSPISTPPPAIPRCTTPTQSVFATPRVLYRLSAVVCHYGQHSFGHYVCFRRKPRSPSSSSESRVSTLTPPRLACPYGCECSLCTSQGHIRDSDHPSPNSNHGWLRISDDSVEECGLERVLAEGVGAFMLFYERAEHPKPERVPVYNMGMSTEVGAGSLGITWQGRSPRSSEETVRPEAWVGPAAGFGGVYGTGEGLASTSSLASAASVSIGHPNGTSSDPSGSRSIPPMHASMPIVSPVSMPIPIGGPSRMASSGFAVGSYGSISSSMDESSDWGSSDRRFKARVVRRVSATAGRDKQLKDKDAGVGVGVEKRKIETVEERHEDELVNGESQNEVNGKQNGRERSLERKGKGKKGGDKTPTRNGNVNGNSNGNGHAHVHTNGHANGLKSKRKASPNGSAVHATDSGALTNGVTTNGNGTAHVFNSDSESENGSAPSTRRASPTGPRSGSRSPPRVNGKDSKHQHHRGSVVVNGNGTIKARNSNSNSNGNGVTTNGHAHANAVLSNHTPVVAKVSLASIYVPPASSPTRSVSKSTSPPMYTNGRIHTIRSTSPSGSSSLSASSSASSSSSVSAASTVSTTSTNSASSSSSGASGSSSGSTRRSSSPRIVAPQPIHARLSNGIVPQVGLKA